MISPVLCFTLVCFVTLNFGTVYSSYDTLNKNTWMALNVPNVCRIVSNLLDESLSEVSVNIVPTGEIANDPLNQYVDAGAFAVQSDSALIEYIQRNLKEASDESVPGDLYRALYSECIENSIAMALDDRYGVILRQQTSRVEKDLQRQSNLMSQFLKIHIKDELDIVDTSYNILRNFSAVPEIIKALSHPVVKEEIITALKNQDADEEWHTTVVNAIVPYLREGIHRYDMQNVANQSQYIAVGKITEVMIPHIGYCVDKALNMARRFDNFLHNTYTENNNFIHTMIEAMMVGFRKSLTYISYTSPNFTRLCDPTSKKTRMEIRESFKLVTGKGWKHTVFELPGETANESLALSPGIDLQDFVPFLEIKNLFGRSLLEKQKSEVKYYINRHSLFSEKDCSKLVEIAREMLKYKYFELKEDNFNDITVIFDNKPYTNNEDTSLLQNQKAFNKELESRAIKLFKFTEGSFTYSSSYLAVMTKIFPSIVNPYKNEYVVLQKKDEL